MTKLLTLVALLVLGSTAHADQRAWSMNAGSCVPTDVDVSLQGTHYWTVTGGMRVKHKGTDINDINLVCPVTSLNPSVPAPNKVAIYHGNTSGPILCPVGSTTCKHYVVIASFRSVDLYDGTYTTLCTMSSNIGQFMLSNGNGHRARTSCDIGPLNTDRYAYWVELTVHRDDANGFPEVNSVELVNATWGASSGGGGSGGGAPD